MEAKNQKLAIELKIKENQSKIADVERRIEDEELERKYLEKDLARLEAELEEKEM